MPEEASAAGANDTPCPSKDEGALQQAAEEIPDNDATNAAATKLQAVQRGKQDRAEVAKKKNVVASKDEAAGAKAAEDFPASDETNAAATKLQAAQRGKQDRAAVEAAKAEHGTEGGALAGKCAGADAEAPAAEGEAAAAEAEPVETAVEIPAEGGATPG